MLFLIQRKQTRYEVALTRLSVCIYSTDVQHNLPANPITAADLLSTHQCPSQYENNLIHCSPEIFHEVAQEDWGLRYCYL